MRRSTGWLGALLSLAFAIAPAFAQDKAATPVPGTAPAPKEPAAVAVADIALRADADERFAEAIILRAREEDPSEQLAPRLDAIARSVDEKAKMFRPGELRELPVMRLESFERHWKFDARLFARWQDDMRAATAPYAQSASQLAQRRADWEATQEQARGGNLPAALASRVDALVAKLRTAEQALSAPLARQIALGRRANLVDARIQTGLRSVAEAIEYIDRRLIRFDSPPLWLARQPTGDSDDAISSIRKGLGIEARFLTEYGASDFGNQRALHVLQVLLLPVLLLLSWRARRARREAERAGAEPEPLDATTRVLQRPFSAWLLLSMMGVLAFEPDAPLLAHQFAMLVALVPVLRLLPPEGRRVLGVWPYVATALYLLGRIAFFFLANALVYRWYHLGLATLALVLTSWLLWRARRQRNAWLRDGFGRAVHVGAWVSVVLLAVSIVANVIGNVSLAEMLNSGVIDSGYFGLVLYAGMTVIVALLRLLLARGGQARLRVVREHATPLLTLIMRVLTFAAIVGWIVFTMNRFRVFRPAYAVAESVLTHSFQVGEFSLSLGHVLVFFVSIYVAFWAAKATRYLLQEEVLTRMSLPRGVGNSVASLTYYAVLLLGALVALTAAGFKMTQLAFVFGALGVGIGFGLQNVVNNFVSGLILMFERPIQPGDVVEITGTSGRVREIGMRATTIKTFDGADVVVPNGTLLSEKLTNWTLLDRNRRLDVDIGVAYGSDPAKLSALLHHATLQTPGIVSNPEPVVLFLGFGASALNFGIRAWTYDYDNSATIRSDLVTRVYGALNQAGIELPFPQQDLHLRSVSEEAAEALRGRRAGRDDQAPDGEGGAVPG
ncbi:mechanosensitive ion channel domain-containing protein [Lysobacter changpingensis]|uniref:mechanosensitive ion channel domain-containing protein n=1 Tax=Lysobacter changpingensis TaxID=2792784 RepID=UPI001A8DDE75|nr:mechanosensitive ion channel domain-containing protein [Lysobacter changpingensis]